MSNSMNINYDDLEKKIKKAKSNKELDKLYKKYRDNLGLSDGDPNINKLFREQQKAVYRATPDSPSPSPSPSSSSSPSPKEFFQNTTNLPNDNIRINYSSVPTNKTSDNRIGCSKPTDCGIRALHGISILSQDERDELVGMIGETGINTQNINDFLKSRQRNVELSEEFIQGLDIHSWAVKKMKKNTCSMVIIGLKPELVVSYNSHAVIICKDKNGIVTLWDTQRYLDDSSFVRNESKNGIKKYLEKAGLQEKNFFLIKVKEEIDLNKMISQMKIGSPKKSKSSQKSIEKRRRKRRSPLKTQKRSSPLKTQKRRDVTLKRRKSARRKKYSEKRKTKKI